MNVYSRAFGHFLIHLLIAFRVTYWKHIRSKTSKTVIVKLTKKDKIRINTYGDIAYTLYSKQPLIWLGDGFESETILLIKKFVKKGDIVFDIGANIGMYSILLSRIIGNTGKVYAFEPDPTTAYYLNENLRLNNCQNVVVLQIALSEENGKIILNKPDGSGDSFNYISKIEDENQKNKAIEAIRLDDFLIANKIDRIDFVKMDIEGAELLCMKGANEIMLAKLRPVIVTEVFEPWCNRFDYTSFELLKFISQYEYRITNYDDHQWLCYPNKKMVKEPFC